MKKSYEENTSIVWMRLKCPKCGHCIEEKEGISGIDALRFTMQHLVECYKMIEVTYQPKFSIQSKRKEEK